MPAGPPTTSPQSIAQAAAQGPPGTTIQTSQASIAALEAFADGPLLDGSVAWVTGVGYYTLAKTSTASADGYAVLTTSSGTGRWVLQFPIVVMNPALLVTDWYLDGTNGVDSNDGKTALTPVKTMTGGLYPKWGTSDPKFPQATTIHVIGTQTVGQERIVFSPALLGANTNLTIDGSAGIVWGNTFGAGSVTPFAWGNPGVDLQIASMPGGTVAGQIVWNHTRSSYAIVRSMSGSTATMDQPITIASLATGPVPDTGWTTGDTISVGTLPYLNLVQLAGTSGDSNATFTGGILTLQFVRVPDVAGISGDSAATIRSGAGSTVVTFVSFDSFAFLDGKNTVFTISSIGCWFGGGAQFDGRDTAVFGGSSNANNEEFTLVSGGVYALGFAMLGIGFISSVNGETVFAGVLIRKIGSLQDNVVLSHDATLTLDQPVGSSAIGAGSLWGDGYLINRGTLWCSPVTSWSNVLNCNLLVGLGSSMANAYVPATNTWCSGIPLTIANLNTWGSLYDAIDAIKGMDAKFIGQGGMPSVPPTWLQTNWYWDPANSSGLALDTNSGADSSHPVLTFNGGFLAKMGTDRPTLPYGQSLIVHQMSAQPAGADPVFFKPKLSGGGQFIIDGRLGWVAAGADFALGALSGSYGSAGAVPAAGDVPMTVAGMPGYVVAGTLVQNTARGSETAVVRSNTTLGQPLTLASLTTTTAVPVSAVSANDWVAGDNIHVVIPPLLNLKDVRVVGGDLTAGGQPSSLWVIGATIADSSGNGGSEFGVYNEGAATVFSMCVFQPRVHIGTSQGRGTSGMYSLGCLFAQNVVTYASNLLSGCVVQNGITTNAGTLSLGANTCVSGASTLNSGTDMAVAGAANGNVWSDATWTLGILSGVNVVGFFHGSYAVTVSAGGVYLNSTGSTFVLKATLTTGALKLITNTTGMAVAANGIPYGPFLLTPANLDTYSGLQDIASGAKFVGGTTPAVPVTWSQATWNIDPQNSQGTSSDNNSGLTSGTALRTWAGFLSKMGTIAPGLSVASVAVTFLSSHTDNTDPVAWRPLIGKGCAVSIQGASPTVVASGVSISGTVAKNRTAGSNSALQTTLSAAAAVGQMVANATHASRSWAEKSLGANAFQMCQPFVAQTVGGTTTPAEVDTWANTDSVSLLSPIAVNLVDIEPTVVDGFGALTLYQLAGFDPLGADGSVLTLNASNGSIIAQECSFQRLVDGFSAGQFSSTFTNCLFRGSFVYNGFFNINGGAVLLSSGVVAIGSGIDGDFIFGASFNISGLLSIGLAFMDAAVTVSGGEAQFGTLSYGSHVLYGGAGKVLAFTSNARGAMLTGTWAAGWTAPTLVTGVTMNGGTVAQTHTNASPDVVTSGVTTSVANADSATGGTMSVWNGSTISKAA